MKPFIKYVGGKTQILDNVFELFPDKINNYYEPFIGGGSVLIELLERIEKGDISVENIFISDINSVLINCYNMIKYDCDNLIKLLEEYKKNYESEKEVEYPPRHKFIINEKWIGKGKQYLYYYYRDLYNKTTDINIKSALLIFLNKTCFRGLYRVGPNGFNVPYGNYKKPEIFNKIHLKSLSQLFNKYDVNFKAHSFEELKKFKKNDFIYLDPPYYPINKTSFTEYDENDFPHQKLVDFCKKLNIKFLQSNSKCDYILREYEQFNIGTIECKRRINSKNPDNVVNEVFINN